MLAAMLMILENSSNNSNLTFLLWYWVNEIVSVQPTCVDAHNRWRRRLKKENNLFYLAVMVYQTCTAHIDKPFKCFIRCSFQCSIG